MPKGRKVPLPKVRLSKKDWATMAREGWAIFNLGEVRQEIERDDESRVFWCDDDAIAHVMRCALAGSKTHIKALVLHAEGTRSRLEVVLNDDGRGEDW